MNRTQWLRLALVLALAAGVAVVVGLREHVQVIELEAKVRALGVWAPLAFVALSLLAALAFLPRLVARLRERPMLPVEALRQRIDQQPHLLVLDVRTPQDFVGEQGHIDGALNVPLEALEDRIASLGEDLTRPIALVCRTDRRSAKAAALLARHGFSQVHVVQGGMTAWNAAGWPVVR